MSKVYWLIYLFVICQLCFPPTAGQSEDIIKKSPDYQKKIINLEKIISRFDHRRDQNYAEVDSLKNVVKKDQDTIKSKVVHLPRLFPDVNK